MIVVNDFSPFVFHFKVGGHDVGLRWYGLAYVLGFVFASLAFKRAIRAGLLPGATAGTQDRLMTAIIAGVLVGGRMGYVLQNLGAWAKDPLFPLKVYEGGMAFFGGLLGVILGLLWVARKEKLAFWSLADTATLPAMLGLAFGRIANFVNAELWGRPTGGNWGVVYPKVDRLPRHPSELYESLSHFLAFGVLLLLSRRAARPGVLSAWFLVLYGLFRFVSDFYRDESLVGPLNTGQYASLVVLALGTGLMMIRARKGDRGIGEQVSTTKDSPSNVD